MSKCPITYASCEGSLYSVEGLRMLSPSLRRLQRLTYSAEELRDEAYHRASKISIQGVQPKLSAILKPKEERFSMVDVNGKFILKPQHEYYPQLPENEDLTMKLAEAIGLEVPLHGMIWSKDNSLTYFIKRFDRKGHKDKLAVEDFAQLAELKRDTKYNYSMERVVKLIDMYCTFPALEKVKLFKLTVFNYLTGNEDGHLKNFSVITDKEKTTLSPCYDLVNSSILLRNPDDEIALSLKGKKSNLNRHILVDYFAKERCHLSAKSIDNVLNEVVTALPQWFDFIENSFLEKELKNKYADMLGVRLIQLKLGG